MENKVRYKLHKVKKQWVTLAVASVALATIVGGSVATSSLASAEETNNSNGSPSTTTVGENTNPVVEKEVGTTTEVANTSNATTTERAEVTADKPAETTVQPNSGATNHSKIIDYREGTTIEDEEAFLEKLLALPDQEAEEGKVFIIHGCKDEYAEFIIDHRDILSTKYIVPYIGKELKDRLIEKESFYQICEEYDLNYPKTHVFNKGDEVVDFGFNYPVILKASDSVTYFQHEFDGMKKAYVVQNAAEFKQITDEIYSHGYEKSLIVQDFIPGDDSHMRVLTCYSDQNGKVKMMCLGHVLLEEHTPKGIGNHAAIITEYDEEVMTKFKNFLESINRIFITFS